MNPHPFMLPPVLEVLFKNCDFETLKRARQVCQLWLDLSHDAFNRSSLINFYNMYPEVYLDMMKSLENGSECAPVNVALTLSPLYDDPDSNNNLSVCPWHICEEFVFPFGNSIEFLKFYAWDSVNEKLNATTFREILLTPEYLKTLEVSLIPSIVSAEALFQLPWNRQPPLFYLKSLVMYGKMDCSEDFLHNFLSAMPNVCSITVNCCSLDFLDLLSTALYRIPLKKMEHLKLNFVGSFTETQILNFKKANFGLRTLHAAPRTLLTDFDEYNQLLTQLAPTLEDAKLTACTRVPSMEQFVTLPVMPKLKVLRLQNWRGGSGFWNLAFINQLPNLETLILEKRGLIPLNTTPFKYTYDMFEEEDVKPHKSLTILVLPSVPLQYPNQTSLISLLFKFSFLKNLTLTADDKSLECICQHAAQLENLTIAEYSEVTDRGITGLFNVDLLSEGEENNCHDLNLGITNLKGLRRLEIDGFAGRVTDFSVQYGLMHLEKLDSIILRSCKITKRGIQMFSKAELAVTQYDTWNTFDSDPIDDSTS